MTYDLFAACAPGLEPITALELNELGFGLHSPFQEGGGVEFRGDLRDVYRSNLHLRTASRVLVRMGTFYAALFPELRKKASHLHWEEFLVSGQAVAFRVTCRKSRLYHQGAVAERVLGAIADRLGQFPPIQKSGDDDETDSAQLIFVRFNENHCTISVDTSGALLHRRGYRLETAKAPLRETIAAGMLLASGWKAESPLLDPFCGSGTIPIEGALLAANVPPGRNRRFAFMDWPNFDKEIWRSILAEEERAPAAPTPAIIGSDRDGGAIRAAQANAERAGVAGRIDFECRAISAIEPPPGPGWIVTNPPYGVRASATGDLRNLYAQTGKVLRARCPGWNIAMLCNSTQLLKQTGFHFTTTIHLMNGGIKVRLSMGKIE